MSGLGWKTLNESPLTQHRCDHPRVSRDPLLGGFTCSGCCKHFDVVPDVTMVLPRALGFWGRLWWAVRFRKKVAVVPFVWTQAWGRARQADRRFYDRVKAGIVATEAALLRDGLELPAARHDEVPDPPSPVGPDGIAPIYKHRVGG